MGHASERAGAGDVDPLSETQSPWGADTRNQEVGPAGLVHRALREGRRGGLREGGDNESGGDMRQSLHRGREALTSSNPQGSPEDPKTIMLTSTQVCLEAPQGVTHRKLQGGWAQACSPAPTPTLDRLRGRKDTQTQATTSPAAPSQQMPQDSPCGSQLQGPLLQAQREYPTPNEQGDITPKCKAAPPSGTTGCVCVCV